METSTGDQEQPTTAANSPIVASTPKRANLGMMVSSAGVKDGAHKCDICGKTFAAPTRLTRHYRIHTGERPFACEVCGKSFAVKENLSVHRRIHTKEKPYSCPHCDRGFEHSGKLSRHVRIHTGERPYKCTDCGKTYIQSGELVIHMRSHTGDKPYVCVVCNKKFTCSKQLTVHSRTHTGERPYACDLCGKTFAYSHVLKLHQNTHFSERLYKCTVCADVTYSSKKALAVHIKTHTISQDRHPRQLPPTHSGAAVVSSFPPTPSSSSTLLPSPTGGTEGIDPKPNRPLRLMSKASGIRIVDNILRNKLMKSNNNRPRANRTLKEDSTIEHLISNSDRSTEGGGTCRQQLLPGSSSGSIFLGKSESVNEVNSNSAKEVFSSDCKTNQHHSGLKDGAHHRDYNMTYSQLIPPLIPITADQSSIPMTISLIHSQQHGTEHPHPQ